MMRQLRPKVRAMIDYDPADSSRSVQQAVAFSSRVRGAFQKGGFEVESIRIATQPTVLDTVSLPVATTEEQLGRILGDEPATALSSAIRSW